MEVNRIEQIAKRIEDLANMNYMQWQQCSPRKPRTYQEYLIANLLQVVTVEMQITGRPGKLDNSNSDLFFCNGLLNTKIGTCMSMNMFYIILADKLNWPIHGVVGGDHLFCRWEDSEYRSNIEATGKGAKGSDQAYIDWLALKKEDIDNSIWMKNLTKKQMIGQFIFGRAICWQGKKRYYKAIEDLILALKLTGKDPQIERALKETKRTLAELTEPNYKKLQKSLIQNRNYDPPAFENTNNPIILPRGVKNNHPSTNDPLYYTQQNHSNRPPTPNYGKP